MDLKTRYDTCCFSTGTTSKVWENSLPFPFNFTEDSPACWRGARPASAGALPVGAPADLQTMEGE